MESQWTPETLESELRGQNSMACGVLYIIGKLFKHRCLKSINQKSLTKNPTHHARTKHIDVQHHFVRERLENGEVQFEYCPTEHMVADVLTKALSKERHHKLINMFGLETS
jgi:hypothetical protein